MGYSYLLFYMNLFWKSEFLLGGGTYTAHTHRHIMDTCINLWKLIALPLNRFLRAWILLISMKLISGVGKLDHFNIANIQVEKISKKEA